MSRCLHCDKEEANYCETCYQALISENAKLQKENEILKCSIAVANKLEERIKEKFISKEKIEEWRKSKDKSLMWSNADDLYYFNKWTKELLESE